MDTRTTAIRHARETVSAALAGWSAHDSPRKAAALAYYSILSLAPLVVVAVAVAGALFGDEAARARVLGAIATTVGPDAALLLERALEQASRPDAGALAGALGLGLLLLGASGAFAELQRSLDDVWEYERPRGRGLAGLASVVRERVPAVLAVLGVGVALALSLLSSVAVGTLGRLAPATPEAAVQAADRLASVVVLTALFVILYRVLPGARIGWSEVWRGSLVTALLFAAGSSVLGLYFRWVPVGSAYGAAGSLLVILGWVYYSSQIVLLGAEITHADAMRRRMRGSGRRSSGREAV